MRDMLIGFTLGWILSVPTYIYFATDDTDELQRRYDAYRLCIPKPGCMTADDYIDYYDLKWKLQQ